MFQMSTGDVCGEAAHGGGMAVAYAKKKGATIIISIGNIKDSENATLNLNDTSISLDDAIKEISLNIRKQLIK